MAVGCSCSGAQESTPGLAHWEVSKDLVSTGPRHRWRLHEARAPPTCRSPVRVAACDRAAACVCAASSLFRITQQRTSIASLRRALCDLVATP